ncbi:LysM peptidoglycan-binding domain-containing protein [Gabonibacter massiliensis]|uniref:LysM peptidoglycan-binding domain-containing protein n=1 Tax=Gabonibacter massiliensis TaxID=1720195 RepID=UPI00073E350B|nr:LysM peptidoglycan-binding domain-containing protein [Gabonibacter massiliensis]
MIRIVLLLVFLGWIGGVKAQDVKIERSKEMVVWKGKTYYLHTVEPGQTLFSICKAYEVSVEEVMVLNEKKDNNLTIHEILKIPYVEPFKRLDNQFYYHKIKPKETLYSLSRKFGIRLKRILKDNPEYNEKDPIPTGSVVRLTLKQIDKDVLNAELAWEDRQVREEAEVEALRVAAQTVKDEVDLEIKRIEEEVQHPVSTYAERPVFSYQVRVALLLPFYLNNNQYPEEKPVVLDSLAVDQQEEKWNLYSKSEPFVQFYEGILMAVDSLKKAGYSVDLQVFDTERDPGKARMIANELNRFNPQLILGPVYANTFQVVADQLYDKSIPMVYPLSARTEGLGRFPNFIQVNTSTTTLLENMADWVVKNSIGANLVVIRPSGVSANSEESQLPYLVRYRLQPDMEMKTINWSSSITVDSLKMLLKPHTENIILFPTVNEAAASRVLPVLSALPDSYKVTVVGFPDWLKFTTLGDDVFFKLNVKLFMNSYVDYQSEPARKFAEQHRKYFYSEPTPIVNRAFDIGLFFMKQVADYGRQVLGHLGTEDEEALFTRFKFKMLPGGGMENRGLYLVHFRSNYEIKITPVN